jgi:hypothetical protein
MSRKKDEIRVGNRVRITGIASCVGLEGPVKAIRHVPPDNRPSHLVELGAGVVWAWAEEIQKLEDPG